MQLRLKVKITKKRALEIIREEIVRRYNLKEVDHEDEQPPGEGATATSSEPIDPGAFQESLKDDDLYAWFSHLNNARIAANLDVYAPKTEKEFKDNLKSKIDETIKTLQSYIVQSWKGNYSNIVGPGFYPKSGEEFLGNDNGLMSILFYNDPEATLEGRLTQGGMDPQNDSKARPDLYEDEWDVLTGYMTMSNHSWFIPQSIQQKMAQDVYSWMSTIGSTFNAEAEELETCARALRERLRAAPSAVLRGEYPSDVQTQLFNSGMAGQVWGIIYNAANQTGPGIRYAGEKLYRLAEAYEVLDTGKFGRGAGTGLGLLIFFLIMRYGLKSAGSNWLVTKEIPVPPPAGVRQIGPAQTATKLLKTKTAVQIFKKLGNKIQSIPGLGYVRGAAEKGGKMGWITRNGAIPVGAETQVSRVLNPDDFSIQYAGMGEEGPDGGFRRAVPRALINDLQDKRVGTNVVAYLPGELEKEWRPFGSSLNKLSQNALKAAEEAVKVAVENATDSDRPGPIANEVNSILMRIEGTGAGQFSSETLQLFIDETQQCQSSIAALSKYIRTIPGLGPALDNLLRGMAGVEAINVDNSISRTTGEFVDDVLGTRRGGGEEQ